MTTLQEAIDNAPYQQHYHLHAPDGECYGDTDDEHRARWLAKACPALTIVNLDYCINDPRCQGPLEAENCGEDDD